MMILLIISLLSILILTVIIIEATIYVRKTDPNKKPIDGTFHINTTNPIKDTIQIELNIPIGEMIEKKELRFVVELDE